MRVLRALLAVALLVAVVQSQEERDGRESGEGDEEEGEEGEDEGEDEARRDDEEEVDINEKGYVDAGFAKNKKRRIEGVDFGKLDLFKDAFGDHTHTQYFNMFDLNKDKKLDAGEMAAIGCSLPRWIAYYDRDDDGAIGYVEFIRWFRERYLWLSAYEAGALDGPDPPGHMKQFGDHTPQHKKLEVDVIEGPIAPKVFWEKYIDGHRPAIFRGVEAQSVGVKRWADEGFLREHYGGIDLKIEPKLEARGDDTQYVDSDSVGHRMNVNDYLDQNQHKNIYAVSILPQQMAWDCNIVPAVLCGSRNKQLNIKNKRSFPHPYPEPNGHSWLTHLYEANLWIAHGRTRSQLHYDKENNMNCLYVGEKQWILMDTRAYFKKLLWARGGKYSSKSDLLNAGTDWVPIEVDGVDMRVHRKMADVPFYQFTQRAGDCVFLPYSMLHYVNKTNPGLQVAMSYMWVPQEQYDHEACEAVPLAAKGEAHVPMAAFDVLYYYNGSGIIPQGYPDPQYEVLTQIEENIDGARNGGYLTKELLQQWVDSGHSSNKHLVDEHWEALIGYAKKDPSTGLHQSEMRWPNVPLDLWTKLAAEFDPEGGLPCDQGQRYNMRPTHEWGKMDKVLDDFERDIPYVHPGVNAIKGKKAADADDDVRETNEEL